MKFFGRKQQQEKIRRVLEKNTLQVVLIYGRRRVGKSELIKQCLKNVDAAQLNYECKQTTEMNNAESLSSLISEQFMLPALGFGSMEDLLEYLFVRAEKEKLILL